MMCETLPRAFRIGFTGTPLLKKDKNNTYLKFGRQIGMLTGLRMESEMVLMYACVRWQIYPQKVSNEKINDY
jgi:type I restriction enzyme R subunit